MGLRLAFIREEERRSDTRYISRVSIYRAIKCAGCPIRGLCNKARENRKIEVNYMLNRYKEKIRDLLNNEESIFHRKKRPVGPEAVFADIKETDKFRRFRLKDVTGVSIEFGLKAVAHNIKRIAVRIVGRQFAREKLQKDINYRRITLKINYYRNNMTA